jgi:hypothetical protein
MNYSYSKEWKEVATGIYWATNIMTCSRIIDRRISRQEKILQWMLVAHGVAK